MRPARAHDAGDRHLPCARSCASRATRSAGDRVIAPAGRTSSRRRTRASRDFGSARHRPGRHLARSCSRRSAGASAPLLPDGERFGTEAALGSGSSTKSTRPRRDRRAIVGELLAERPRRCARRRRSCASSRRRTSCPGRGAQADERGRPGRPARLPREAPGRVEIRKLLVANRGEIAVRVFATCGRLGIGTVAVFAPDDEGAFHTRRPTRRSRSRATSTRPSIVGAAKAGADAVHPGYGFLAENGDFAEAVASRPGIVFVGPPPPVLRAAGTSSRRSGSPRRPASPSSSPASRGSSASR